MSNGTSEADWRGLLTEMTELVMGCDLRKEVPEDVLARRWLGEAPATDEAIRKAEARLGAQLPQSYKAFLRVANGWHWPRPDVRMILPVERIERLAVSSNPDIVAWRSACANARIAASLNERLNRFLDQNHRHKASNLTEFLDTDELKIAAMIEISLEQRPISKALILLNPLVSSNDGEMQTSSTANWRASGGTFWEFMNSGRDALAQYDEDYS